MPIFVILVLLVGGAFFVMWELGGLLQRSTDWARASVDSTVLAAVRPDTTERLDSATAADTSRPADSLQKSQALVRAPDTTERRDAIPRRYPRTLLGDAGGSPDTALFLIVLLSGALGGLLHSIRSFVWYVGNRELRWSWIPRYLVLPIEGALLSAVTYLLVRAGFLGFQGNATPSAYGFAGAGALMGMFSQPAILKLKQVAETLFTTPPQGSDAVPQGAAAAAGGVPGEEKPEDKPGDEAPAPVLAAAARATEGGKPVLRLTGSAFRSRSIVEVNGAQLIASSVTAKEIIVPLSDDLAAAALEVKVTTPPPGGGTSNPMTVASPAAGG